MAFSAAVTVFTISICLSLSSFCGHEEKKEFSIVFTVTTNHAVMLNIGQILADAN